MLKIDYVKNIEDKLHNGNPYDKEILDGVFEHLAIVENPRYEGAMIAVNAIMDKNAICRNEFKEEEHPRDDDGKFAESQSSIKEWGNEYKEYSGNPDKAIEHLLKNKNGFVPAAIHKEEIGDIDFVYGKEGKNGYGLAHIIERRNSEGQNGEEFVRSLPTLIRDGSVISKKGHNDRKYILSKDKEIALKLDFNGEKRNWVVSTYAKKELQGSNSFKDRYTKHAHDSNLNVANGYVSIATPINNIITDVKSDFNPTAKNQIQQEYYNIINYIKNRKRNVSNAENNIEFAIH